MGKINYHSIRQDWPKIEAKFASSIDFVPLRLLILKTDTKKHGLLHVFDTVAAKKKEILALEEKEKERKKREFEREEQRQKELERKRVQERKERESLKQQQEARAKTKKEQQQELDKKNQEDLLQKLEALKKQREREAITKRQDQNRKAQKQRETRKKAKVDTPKKASQLDSAEKSTSVKPIFLILLVLAGIAFTTYFTLFNSSKFIEIRLNPSQYSNSENVEHVIDAFINKRDKLIYGRLYIDTDVKSVDITLQGDFGIKEYYSGISIPVGLYKIEARTPSSKVIAHEYISTDEDKHIVLLFNSKNRTVKDLYRLINRYPDAVNLYTERIIKLVRNKDHLNAINFLDSSIHKFPKAAELYNNKARILSTDAFFLNEKMFKREDLLIAGWKSIEMNPSTRMLDGLSEALAANSEYDLAIKLQSVIKENLDLYYSIYNSKNKRFTSAIDEKKDAYSKELLWTPEGNIPNIVDTNEDNQTTDKSIYIETSEYTAFITESKKLEGKYPTSSYCKMYSRVATRQYDMNFQIECNLDAENDPAHPRWHNDNKGHYQFCKRYSVYASRKEVKARELSLKECEKP